MIRKLLEVFSINRKRVAVTPYAYNVTETRKLNGVSELTFSLPSADPKNSYLVPRNFVRFNHGDLYRIMDYTIEESDIGSVNYVCEHVIATLADSLLYGDHIMEGYRTRDVLRYVLNGQSDWALSGCDFDYDFDYAWTSENRLNALFSIPIPFTSEYRFIFDTSIYPWRISLKRMDVEAGTPTYHIFAGLNFLSMQKTRKSTQVVTRLYCQGYGEGINQLGIESVNPTGLPYIQAPQSVINQYGIVEAHFVDRSYEDARSLYAAGVAALLKLQEPRREYEVSALALEGISSNSYLHANEGEIMLFREDHFKTYIVEMVRNHDIDGDITLKIANTPEDIAQSIADIANRQRIETTYAQGATQLWGSPLIGNASPNRAFTYPLWIPDATRVVNYVKLKIDLGRFRADGRATSSGGASAQTSGAGGGGTATSNGGGSYRATEPARVSALSIRAQQAINNDGVNKPYTDNTTATSGSAHRHYHMHYHSIIGNINIPALVFEIPNHTHSVSTGSHSHSVNIPAHRHDIEYGIYEAPETPESALISINGRAAFSMGKSFEGDITQYLIGENGEIPRGRFVDISVAPNINAHVRMSVAAQGFIQSREGGRY